MSATLFKEVTYSLNKLIEDIDMGELGLPEIQRPFVWYNAKVRDLFDSMYKGFPVGYFLFWANGLSGAHRQIGTDSKQKVPRLLIVDGQQRLTSLFAVIKGVPVLRENFQREHIRIAFRPRDRKFEVSDAAIQRDPEFITDISQLWSKEGSRHRFVKAFIERLRASRDVSDLEEEDLIESIDHLYDLQTYPFTAMELSHSVDEERVAEVFVRINSQGKVLNQADFILTLMSVFWDDGRTDLETFCRGCREPSAEGASPFNHYLQPDPDQMLRVGIGLAFRRARLQHVYSILRGKDLETEEFSDERRVRQFEILRAAQRTSLDLQNWQEYLKVLLRAGYRGSGMISSQVGAIYCYTIYLIGKRDLHVDPYQLRDVMARWFFMSALRGRYTASAESMMEQDLARFRPILTADEFVTTLDHIIRDTLTEDYWSTTLPNDLGVSVARGPAPYAYYAALNLLEARALFSKLKVVDLLDPSSRGKKSAVERHHLFPKAYLARQGITRISETNQIANFALAEWSDNISIKDEPPADYFPKYASRMNPEELRQMTYWHALPDVWQEMEYADFLSKRRRLIAGVIRDAYEKLR